MTEPADVAVRVTEALRGNVLPSVIARGGSVRVLDYADGVVSLEVSGSPGAVYPLASRIRAAIRAAVPEVSDVRLVTPAASPGSATASHATASPSPTPTSSSTSSSSSSSSTGTGNIMIFHPSSDIDLAEAARRVVEADVNPAIAAHRGHVTVTGATADGWIRIRLEGGCQGCSLAEVTIRQGIEPLLRARLPGMTGLSDITDHEAGTEPFYSPSKR